MTKTMRNLLEKAAQQIAFESGMASWRGRGRTVIVAVRLSVAQVRALSAYLDEKLAEDDEKEAH
jgi:hypothetical protein